MPRRSSAEPLTTPPLARQVKAITYSHMQIHERAEDSEIYCIVDI